MWRKAGRHGLWLLALLLLAGIMNGPRLGRSLHLRRLEKLDPAALAEHVRRRPEDLDARYRMALLYGRENRHLEATRELLTVLEKDPLRYDVLNDLGVSYMLQQRYYEALVALQGALQVRPDYARAWANLGRLHLATRMPFTAVQELEKAARLDPRSVEVLCDLGEAYQRTLNLNAAEEAYRRALRLRPDHITALIGWSKTSYGLGRHEEAEARLLEVLKQRPDQPEALLTLGRLRLEVADTETELRDARGLLERAAELDEHEPEAWYDRGRTALRLGEAEESVVLFRRALALSPEHPGAMNQLSRALDGAGRPDEARQVREIFRRVSLRTREESRLEERVREAPDDWDAQARLAEIYLESNKMGLAGLVIRRLRDGAPDHPRLPELQQRQAAWTARNERSGGAPRPGRR